MEDPSLTSSNHFDAMILAINQFKTLNSGLIIMSGRVLLPLGKFAARATEAAAKGPMQAQAEALQTVRDMAVVLPQRLERWVQPAGGLHDVVVK